MTIHTFPNDGERFWQSLVPRLRDFLVAETGPENVEAVLANLAPIVRQVGEHASGPSIEGLSGDDAVNAVNRWFRDIVHLMLTALAVQELEMIALRAERDDLRAQLRRPRAT